MIKGTTIAIQIFQWLMRSNNMYGVFTFGETARTLHIARAHLVRRKHVVNWTHAIQTPSKRSLRHTLKATHSQNVNHHLRSYHLYYNGNTHLVAPYCLDVWDVSLAHSGSTAAPRPTPDSPRALAHAAIIYSLFITQVNQTSLIIIRGKLVK